MQLYMPTAELAPDADVLTIIWQPASQALREIRLLRTRNMVEVSKLRVCVAC